MERERGITGAFFVAELYVNVTNISIIVKAQTAR